MEEEEEEEEREGLDIRGRVIRGKKGRKRGKCTTGLRHSGKK